MSPLEVQLVTGASSEAVPRRDPTPCVAWGKPQIKLSGIKLSYHAYNLPTWQAQNKSFTTVSNMPQEETIFTLSYKDLLIGKLSWRNGRWTFGYSDAFRSQNEIAPLVSFSDVKRVYESAELWPFFVSRILGTRRPKILVITDEEGIDERDLAALLTRFGWKTIANPFILEARTDN